MNPEQTCDFQCASDQLSYSSDADAHGQANHIFKYAPKSTPTTSTVQYSLGTGLSKDGLNGTFGFSYQVSKSDLDIIDQSNTGAQLAQMLFNYKYSSLTGIPQYALGASTQNVSFIYKGVAGATNCKFELGRNAKFRKSMGVGLPYDTLSSSSTGVLTLYK